MCLDGEKNDRVAFQARADYQNHAIGWLHRGYSSLGGGKVVRFPRIWMVYGECRLRCIPPANGGIRVDIQARPRDIERVAEQLAELPEIVFLGICTGAYNINAAAVFVSNDAMYKFMTHELSKVPGIERTQIANIIRVIKREHSLPILRV